MKSFVVSAEQDGKNINRIITSKYKFLPQNALLKALRKKDIKVNGTRIKSNIPVQKGDYIELYIPDTILFGTPVSNGYSVAYEDENLLIVDKEQGVSVHPDAHTAGCSLIEKIESHRPVSSEFPITLCHRLDRNTGGLLILAKNRAALDAVRKHMKNGEIIKQYSCTVLGVPDFDEKIFKAFLVKDERKSRVFIYDAPTTNSCEIITRIKFLNSERSITKTSYCDISQLQAEPITGRTHQIRAHLAYIGYPVLGDGKYGSNDALKIPGITKQQLFADIITFRFNRQTDSLLAYLNNTTIRRSV